MVLATATCALVLGVLYATQPTAPEASEAPMAAATLHGRPRPTETLYQELCSLCHGATGGGDGPTQLERPARNFIAGAYAYGDTLSKVMRTLEFGIPGSAMPAFGETLSLQERTAMARYVLGLRPQPRRITSGAGDIASADRPVVLHAAFEDPAHPELALRSLLVGFPNGYAAELRTDNLAALALYQGTAGDAFARRADWRGQGGVPVRALGERLWSLPQEASVAPYSTVDGRPLASKLRSTRVHPGHVTLRFDLIDSSGTQIADGVETIRFLDDDPAVLVRSIELTPGFQGVVRAVLKDDTIATSAGATVREAVPGLFVLDPGAGSPGSTEKLRRDFVYAERWSSSFESAP